MRILDCMKRQEKEAIIYKVTFPNVLGWPTGEVILHINQSAKKAAEYIESYPLILCRAYMKVVPELVFILPEDD